LNILENDILRLRAPEPTDLDLMYIWENDPSIWLAGTTLVPFSRYVLKRYLDSVLLDIFESKQIKLIIDIKKENINLPVGAIDIFDFDPHNRRAGIGILIATSTERRKGYASEALKLTINYVFKILSLHQLYCDIEADNEASLQLFQKLNFTIIGLKKEWILRGHEWKDEYQLQLINAH